MLKKSLKQALIVSPCILGLTILTNISPSLAEQEAGQGQLGQDAHSTFCN